MGAKCNGKQPKWLLMKLTTRKSCQTRLFLRLFRGFYIFNALRAGNAERDVALLTDGTLYDPASVQQRNICGSGPSWKHQRYDGRHSTLSRSPDGHSPCWTEQPSV